MSLSARQLLFSANLIKLNHTKLSYCAFNNANGLESIVVCDTILIDGYYPQYNKSLVTLVFVFALCKEHIYCKMVSLNAYGLLLLLEQT